MHWATVRANELSIGRKNNGCGTCHHTVETRVARAEHTSTESCAPILCSLSHALYVIPAGGCRGFQAMPLN
jgi:hypothetical protein